MRKGSRKPYRPFNWQGHSAETALKTQSSRSDKSLNLSDNGEAVADFAGGGSDRSVADPLYVTRKD